MALTQRLEFRQSQSLVMTPQLMQAIKLLQLSNLDLSAFVEEELERNPLLERTSDGAEPPVAGEAVPERAEFADSDDSGAVYGDDFGVDHSDFANGSAGENFEPVQEEWMNSRPRQPRRDRADPRYRARQCVLRGTSRGRRPRGAGCGTDGLY